VGIKNKQTECFKNYGVVHRKWQIQAKSRKGKSAVQRRKRIHTPRALE